MTSEEAGSLVPEIQQNTVNPQDVTVPEPQDVQVDALPEPQDTPVDLVVDEPGETTVVETTDVKPEESVAKPVQPGTPDKALQKLQQDNAAALRRIEALEAKNEPLTQKEQHQLTEAKSKVKEIKARLNGDFDAFEHGKDIAAATVEVGDTVEQLQERLSRLERENESAKAAQAWSQAEAKYPGVDVRSVFKKSVDDAVATLGEDAPATAIQRLATRWFDERSAAVVASKKTTVPKATNIRPVQTVTKPAASTPRQQQADDYSILLKPE